MVITNPYEQILRDYVSAYERAEQIFAKALSHQMFLDGQLNEDINKIFVKNNVKVGMEYPLLHQTYKESFNYYFNSREVSTDDAVKEAFDFLEEVHENIKRYSLQNANKLSN
ncbi:MAG: hypothetical protein KDK61_09110 [Simkania sp.]|nr:hypothetical protein [Nanoarchaeota archaeon]MCB1084455.1 hypothetical protein [Simkania sp.]